MKTKFELGEKLLQNMFGMLLEISEQTMTEVNKENFAWYIPTQLWDFVDINHPFKHNTVDIKNRKAFSLPIYPGYENYIVLARISNTIGIPEKSFTRMSIEKALGINVRIGVVKKKEVLICPNCENPYPHTRVDGTHYCQECMMSWG